MTVDLTKDQLLLIHQAIKEYSFDLLNDQLNYDIDTSDEQKEYNDLDNKLQKYFEQKEE
jgi:hypothetical protein